MAFAFIALFRLSSSHHQKAQQYGAQAGPERAAYEAGLKQ